MQNMVFENGYIILENEITYGYAAVSDGKIAGIGKGAAPAAFSSFTRYDLDRGFLSPGFIDSHTHGAGGSDFLDGTEEAFRTACRAHLAHGTTSIMPTSLACPDDELFQFFDCYEHVKDEHKNMPHLIGVHLEGPYFSPSQAGAQSPECMTKPFPRHFYQVLERGHGNIKRWSCAPEIEGVIELGPELLKRGILPSIAHTDADLDVIEKAYANGYHHLTHFYSGMSTIHRVQGYRILGAVESGYLLDDMNIELICDGLHLPPELLKMIFKLKDHDHITAVTDSMRAAGMPDGPTVLGSLKHNFQCISEGGVAKVPDRSCFAGSTATTDRMLRVLVNEADLPLWEAVRLLSLNPAKLYHLDDHTGSIKDGKDADLVVLTPELQVKDVFVSGIKVDRT